MGYSSRQPYNMLLLAKEADTPVYKDSRAEQLQVVKTLSGLEDSSLSNNIHKFEADKQIWWISI